jgi:prepilin signal peptidase PulO-like enzyme (type II secretory pathway)
MIVAPAIVFIFAFQLILENDPLLYAIGVLVGMAFFALQYLVSRGTWIGKGDIRIGALMGAILGWKILIIALAISYFFGGGIALYLILTHRKTRKDSIPFGPFLVVGTFIAMIWGERILEWYLGLIGF